MNGNSLGLTHESRIVKARVIALPPDPFGDFTCQDVTTGSVFKLEQSIGIKDRSRQFKVGDVFDAVVHPVEVVFAIQTWHGFDASASQDHAPRVEKS